MTLPEFLTGFDKPTLAVVLFVLAMSIILVYSVVDMRNSK